MSDTRGLISHLVNLMLVRTRSLYTLSVFQTIIYGYGVYLLRQTMNCANGLFLPNPNRKGHQTRTWWSNGGEPSLNHFDNFSKCLRLCPKLPQPQRKPAPSHPAQLSFAPPLPSQRLWFTLPPHNLQSMLTIRSLSSFGSTFSESVADAMNLQKVTSTFPME